MSRLGVERLLAAAAWGAALAAACGGGEGAETKTDAGADAATDAVTDVIADVTADTTALAPYPDQNLGCFGPIHDSGYYGQCCYKVTCGDQVDGACPPVSEARAYISGFPSGSGTCACGDPASGPYAPRSASEGPCCYVVGIISCDGRPLLVGGVPRLAPLIARADWAWS